MKITKSQLRRIIKEELSRVLTENRIPDLGPFGSEEEAEDSLEKRLRTPMSALSGMGLSKDDFSYEKREDGFYVVHDAEGSAGDGELSDSEARDLEGLVDDATADALSDGGDESSSSDLEKKADLFAKNIGKQVRGSGTGGATIEGPPLMDSDGRYSVPLSSPYGEPDYVSIENLEIINPQSAGETMREQTVKITRRQLTRIIKEEKAKILLTEAAYVHDIFQQAANALEARDPATLEGLAQSFGDLMMNEREQRSFQAALDAMLEAAYELESMDEEESDTGYAALDALRAPQAKTHPLDADGDGKLTISEMKITRK